MSLNLNAQQAIEQIKADGEEKNTPEVRVIKNHVKGKVIRQGDIYIHMVGPRFKHGDSRKDPQLAEGNSKGSRHVLKTENVELYQGTTRPTWVDEEMPLGPFFKVKDTDALVSHPEHAHVQLPPGCYQVTHQLDARTRERVQD